MKVDPKSITIDDMVRYFQGSYILDPHNGLPSIVYSIGRNEEKPTSMYPVIMVQNFSFNDATEETVGNIVTYETAKTLPFYDFSLYSRHQLGYKSAKRGQLLQYLTLVPAAVAGFRGINYNRLRWYREEVNRALFQDVYSETIVENNALLARAVCVEQTMPAAAGISGMLDGTLASAVLNKDVALSYSTDDDCASYPINILYRRTLAGKVSVSGEPKINRGYEPVLEEVFQDGR